jgi:hypothetical protein
MSTHPTILATLGALPILALLAITAPHAGSLSAQSGVFVSDSVAIYGFELDTHAPYTVHVVAPNETLTLTVPVTTDTQGRFESGFIASESGEYSLELRDARTDALIDAFVVPVADRP